jgi:hypothetical protein
MHPTIDKASVILRMIVISNKNGVFQLKDLLEQWYELQIIVLNLCVQPFMLSKTTIKGFGLTNVNLEQCLNQILTSTCNL